ncbi:ATP-binding protein [Hymenobacter convexus]|uniref:ATP-binding protein n=1 Tax=Hymenobacter sp. CA1UV-4 TaxID=3063782 RepID=UPI002712E68E|nr:ATP-binding protein [Hymenobacter sp. CA1UV-4]MDO7854099.1 ATP-binding protein [Hymenobacter sp. CA1UV-4]
MSPSSPSHAAVLAAELHWLQQLIDLRLRLFFEVEPSFASLAELPPPPLPPGSAYADFVTSHALSTPERTVLALTLAPHLRPEMLDGFFAHNTTYNKRFTEFGGWTGRSGNFLPTGETALFLLAGADVAARIAQAPALAPEGALLRSRAVRLEPVGKDEPLLSGGLCLAEDYAAYFTTGTFGAPPYNERFPAKIVATTHEWADLVHDPYTLQGVTEIQSWLEHGAALLRDTDLGRWLKPGYRALFYGPPGTGKTVTAALLGKSTGRDVYRVDLSMIVSKYIGETEKNLAAVFDQAEDKDWILFFDEADALFGKRVETASANDRFANQEVAYLLQRIEDHRGVIILASNLKDNIDKAFLRRFQTVVYFPVPGEALRHTLWQRAFASGLPLAADVDLARIAQKWELAGGSMINVIRYCNLKARAAGASAIQQPEIEAGIRRELQKEGILLTH